MGGRGESQKAGKAGRGLGKKVSKKAAAKKREVRAARGSAKVKTVRTSTSRVTEPIRQPEKPTQQEIKPKKTGPKRARGLRA